MKTPIFTGAATALITPFRNREIDYEAFGTLIDNQLNAGIDALVICGTTGEASTLTDDEQISAIEFAVKRVAGKVPVIAGAGSNDTEHAIRLCRRSCEVGADALLIVTPYYNKTSQRGLIHMYTRIADSVDKPIILYNVPSRTGVNIEPETYAALADHPNINAIKECVFHIFVTRNMRKQSELYLRIVGVDYKIFVVLGNEIFSESSAKLGLYRYIL